MNLSRIAQDLAESARTKRHIALSVAALVVVDAVVGLAGYLPLSRDVVGRERNRAQIEKEADKVHALYLENQKLADELYASQVAVARFRNDIVGTREERYLAVKKTLESIGSIGSAGAQQMLFRSGNLEPGFVVHSTELNVEGPYSKARQVLGQVLQSQEFLIVDGVGLTNSNAKQKARIEVSTAYTLVKAREPKPPLEGAHRAAPGTASKDAAGKGAPATKAAAGKGAPAPPLAGKQPAAGKPGAAPPAPRAGAGPARPGVGKPGTPPPAGGFAGARRADREGAEAATVAGAPSVEEAPAPVQTVPTPPPSAAPTATPPASRKGREGKPPRVGTARRPADTNVDRPGGRGRKGPNRRGTDPAGQSEDADASGKGTP